jgi:lactate permease
MFHQLLTPVGNSLLPSFLVAALPIIVVLLLLGWARRPAWQASLAGLIVGLIVAILVWQFPVGLAVDSVVAGGVFALLAGDVDRLQRPGAVQRRRRLGPLRRLSRWTLAFLPNDRRVVLVVIGFCFGALLEGVCGFGTPVAITGALLIAVGFKPLDAIVYTLMFNTAPVAFGALGVPVTTLGSVTSLPSDVLGAMIGRQLPFIAILLPFYVDRPLCRLALDQAPCGRCCWWPARSFALASSSPPTTWATS